MARLRFPGRPGHRYGRSLVRYLPEKDRNRQHAFFARTAAIQRNLKWFYDLFGDSDEEDDFQGFSAAEIGALPSPLKGKKWAKKEDPSLSPKIKNVKASWPILGRRAGREIHYGSVSCAEMKRGEWNTAKPYRQKQSRVVDGRIQRLKRGKAGAGVGNREKRSVGRLSYRDMIKGLDIVRPKLIPPKPPKPPKLREPKAGFAKGGGKIKGKILLPFMRPKQKAGVAGTGTSPLDPTKVKIKLLGDGKQAEIVKGRGRPRKDTTVSWGKAKLEKAQLLLKKAKGKKLELPMKFKPWEKKKWLMAQAQNGTLDNAGKVLCVPKSKQVNMSKAKELVKKAKDAQRKNQEVFGSDTPGKRSVKCSSKLADMDIKGVDLHFLHRKVTPPSRKMTLSKQASFNSKKKLKLGGKALEKTPKPPRPSFGFVMPVVSSRSSRVIKPTKRFIEQEEFGPGLFTSPISGQDASDWSDLPSDLESSFVTPDSSFQTPEVSDVKKSSKTTKSEQTELSVKSSDKVKTKHKEKKEKNTFQDEFLKTLGKKKSSKKSDSKVKLENEADKENSEQSEENKKQRSDRLLSKIRVKVKNGIALTESQEEVLLGTTEEKWQSLRAVYKKVVKKDTLTEAELVAIRTSSLVLFQTLRTGEEIMHVRGRTDGLPTVCEIMEKSKSGMEVTSEEKEKLNCYKRIASDRQAVQRSKQRAEKLLQKEGEVKTEKECEVKAEGEGETDDGEPPSASSVTPRVEGSPKPSATSSSPRAKKKPELTEEEKAEQLERERERLMKKFLEEKENYIKSVTEHREALPAEGQPSMRALYRKVKQGLELTPDEMERMKKDRLITNRRNRLRNLKKVLQKVCKDSGKEDEAALLDGKEPESLALAGDSLGLSPNSRRLLALGSELFYDSRKKDEVKKKKKKKKKKVLSTTLDVGLSMTAPLTKAERLQLKKKKKRKKGKDGLNKDIKLRKKNASSKLLLKAKQRKQKGKGIKVKKSAARKLKLGDVLEDEKESPSRMKCLLHDKLLSPSDKTIQDTVSRQMADALEADMSPDQTEASNTNAHQVANEVTIGNTARSGGPRIKHVCRRASVALGYSPARFEGQTPANQDSLKLSALPIKERKKLFTSDDDNSDTETGSEGGQHSNETSPRLSTRKRKPTAKKRAMDGFLTMGQEANYMDNTKDSDFTLKKEPAKAPKMKKVHKENDSVSAAMPFSLQMTMREEDPNVKRRSKCGQCSACLRKYDCKKCVNCLDKPKYGGRGTKKQACIHRKCHNLVKMKMMRLKQMRAAAKKQMAVQHQLENVPGVPRPAGARIKRAGGDTPIGLPLVPKTKKGQAGDKSEKTDAGSKPLRTVKFSKKIPGKHLIKTDFKDDYDMSVAWKRGMVIISSDPMIPRTICYLCGSNGKHELVYCNVCCEPYHEFCLEEDERPLPDEKENWCCRNCRFCHVCDHQDKLLTCHKCHCSYHAECLGPNYPTKPSKKRKIWVCSRCVRCKSCGATTPGSDPKAQWMHGFSHCQECGKLFEKGNYCPVCKKCYEDDDFESKMMQCADCSRWVHAKCENLSDDQYRILTELPDSVPYRCPPCAQHKPTPWKEEVNEELQAGFVNVLNALYSCKNAGHLIWPNRRFKYMRKVHQGDSNRSSSGPESRDSASSPAPSEASSLERETPTPDRALESGGDGGASSAQDDVEETYSFRRGKTVRRVLRRRRQQRNAAAAAGRSDAGKSEGAGKGDREDGGRSRDCEVEDVGRTLRDGDESKSDSADIDVITVEGESDVRTSGQVHSVFDTDADRICDGVEGMSLADDSGKTKSNLLDEEKVIVVDDAEDDALRTRKEEQKSLDEQSSFSTIAKDTSQECSTSGSHVPNVARNAERSTLIVSLSTNTVASSAAKATVPLIVEDQKHKPQSIDEFKDRTAVVPGEPKSADNSTGADSQGRDHQDGLERTPGDSRMDIANLASDDENSAAEDVDIDVEGSDVNCVEKMEVDSDDDRSLVEDRTSMDTKTVSAEHTFGTLADASKVSSESMLSATLEKEEAESAEGVPDVDSNIPDAVMEVTTSTQSEQDSCRTPVKVVTIEIGKREEEEKKEEEIKPTSFQFVKAKMMAGYYKSVEKFCRDCVTIFQASINQETDLIPGLSKSNVIAKAAFLKIMTQMFPWFNVEEASLWKGEERYQENGVLQVAVEPPHKDHEYAQWRHRSLMPSITTQPSPFKKLPTPRRRHSIIGGDGIAEDDSHATALDDVSDPRRCCLCGVMGDDDPNNAGRLLYCGQDEWIHINCALWSAEVFEEVDGSLINVHAAISRGRMMRCEVCNNLGATVGCCSRGCPANFHFMCARSRNAMFQEDKKVYCFQHADKVDKAIMGSDLFGVLRRVCVSLDNMKANRTFAAGLEAKNINVMIGAWSLESLGHLGFLSDTEKSLFPLDFACSRVYWSTVDPCRRCIYTMRIIEVNPLTSPTTPQEINHTTEHSPGSYPFGRKATLQDDDDADILTDALMEATKESNEAAMALDQVAALLAGSQTVSEIQNAADALAATSSLFEMDDGVLDSLNLDANLNSGLDSDGIMDMMADLDNLDGLNSDGGLGKFSESSEKFLQSDKPVTHSAEESAPSSMDDIVAAVPEEGQKEISTPQTYTPEALLSSEEKTEADGFKETEEKPSNPGNAGEKPKNLVASTEAESGAENSESISIVDGKDKEIATVETSDSVPTSNISVDEHPDVARPDSPLISPKKVPYVKLVDIKDKQMASTVSADSADASDMAVSVDGCTEVAQPDSPLISPKKVPMLKLVKLPLDQHENSYQESEEGVSDATSNTSRNSTPCPGHRDSLDSPQTSAVLSTGESPSLPTVSTSPSEKEPSAREAPNEALLGQKGDLTQCHSNVDSVLSAKSREEQDTNLASCDSEEPQLTKDLPDKVKEDENVEIDSLNKQNDDIEVERTETNSSQNFLLDSTNVPPCEETSSMLISAHAKTREVTLSDEQTASELKIHDILSQKDESLNLKEQKMNDTVSPGSTEEHPSIGTEITSQGQVKSDDLIKDVVVSSNEDMMTSPKDRSRDDDSVVSIIPESSVKPTPAESERTNEGGRECFGGAEDQTDGLGLKEDHPASWEAKVGIEEKSMSEIPGGDSAKLVFTEETVSVHSRDEKRTLENHSPLRTDAYIPTYETGSIHPLAEKEARKDLNVQHTESKLPPTVSPPMDEINQVQSPVIAEVDDTQSEKANLFKGSLEQLQESMIEPCVEDVPTQSATELDTAVSSNSMRNILTHQVERCALSPGKGTSVDDLPSQSHVALDDDDDVVALSTDSLSRRDISGHPKNLESQEPSPAYSLDTPAADQNENTTNGPETNSTNNRMSVLPDEESLSNPDDGCHEVQDVSSDDEVEPVEVIREVDTDVTRAEELDLSPHICHENAPVVGSSGHYLPTNETNEILNTKDQTLSVPDVSCNTHQDAVENREQEPKTKGNSPDVTEVSFAVEDSLMVTKCVSPGEKVLLSNPKNFPLSVGKEEHGVTGDNAMIQNEPPTINDSGWCIASGSVAGASLDTTISPRNMVEDKVKILVDAQQRTEETQRASHLPLTLLDAQSAVVLSPEKGTTILNEEKYYVGKEDDPMNKGGQKGGDDDDAEKVKDNSGFCSLTEELRMQGVGEEDIINIIASRTQQSPNVSPDEGKPGVIAKDAPPRRLSSDPEHESIFKALATSLSSSVARKNNNNRKSPRMREREPILSAFASDLNSKHHKSTQECGSEKVENIVSPTTSRNIFKKLDNPKFANAFKAFMETKHKTASSVVDDLIDKDLVVENKIDGDVSYSKVKTRRSSRLSADSSAEKSSNVLLNGDDLHIASSFENSDPNKRRNRHSSSDVLESDDSSSKLEVLDLSHQGRKKYPMRTTSSRLLRIADGKDPDNQVFSLDANVEDYADVCHDEEQEGDKSSLKRKSSESSHDSRRRLSSDDSLKSPKSTSGRKSHHAGKQDNFDGDQEEKENEAVKGRRGRPKKYTDTIWSPEKEGAALNHLDADEVEGRPMRTRGHSRKPSARMKEIIAAELEDEDDEDVEIEIKKKGRGRSRKHPASVKTLEVHHSMDGEVKPRGRGRPRKYPSQEVVPTTEERLSRDQNEARKRTRGSSSDDIELLEKGKQEEESMPKRKRGLPRLSDEQQDEGFVGINDENDGDDRKKRIRRELTSTSEEEQQDSEPDFPSLRTRSSTKRLKPGDDTLEAKEDNKVTNANPQSEERQVHPRKQSVTARSFPGEDTQSETRSPAKKEPLSDRGNVNKKSSVLPDDDDIMHGEAAITPEQVQEAADTSSKTPKVESPSPSKKVRVTVRIDPVTGAISEVVTHTDDEPREAEVGSKPPQASPVEESPKQPALPSQTPFDILDKSHQDVTDVDKFNQPKGPEVIHVHSNPSIKKVVIGKDVTTNEVVYSNGPTRVRNPTFGPRFRGPSTQRYPGLQRNNTRQARTRGPFSRSSSVLWKGNTATLKPGVNTRTPIPPVEIPKTISNLQGVSPQAMVIGVTRQSISPTGQPISNLIPNTVPGALSSPGVSPAMNLQPLPQTTLVATTIVTTTDSTAVLSVITTAANTVTSTAQEQYLSILQKSYQASQLQQVSALGGMMPLNFSQPGLLQNFGVPQIGVASPEVTPFINQTHPGVMASPTVQTLQTIIQQAGVQSMNPGVQPLTPSPTPIIPVSPLLPPTPMDTSLSGLMTSLSPPLQQQPGVVPLTGFTEAASPFHVEHMYARQTSGGSSRRRKSPHQVKVWFDSYGSLKNEDDENQEDASNEIPPAPSPVKTPSVRMKNPSNMPRARVKNPTFGVDESRSNKALVKLSKKKPKGADASGWNPNASLDPFAGLSADDAFFAAMPNLGQSDHHDDSPSLLLTLMEQEKRRGPSTTPRRPSNRPHLMFEIRSDDGFETRAETIEEAWGRVVERVGELRTNTRMKHLSFDGVKGMKMLGITHEAIIFLLEQLYGAGNCHNYKFKFHKHEETAEDDEPPVNPNGCARAEVFKRTSTFDIFNFLASHHRNRPVFNEFEQQDESFDVQHKSSRRATSLQDLPMAMRFRHLKQTAKEAVGVYRSGIHGRGLFCRRPIEAGEMVIEYSGTVIRSILTDKREKYYESKGIGCYMFRIDDYDVVDATTHGNAARFINHSCDPNCFSRVIEIAGQKHIIIFASRRIAKGEELTYDYKFPIEEVKIPCNCGSRKCRKYLN